MNQKKLEDLYITGNYSALLEEISLLNYNSPSTTFNNLERAICLSYHSRTLIRLGKINDAEKLIQKVVNKNLKRDFSISELIHQTTIINLQITRGNTSESIDNGLSTLSLIDENLEILSEYPRIFSFWSIFLYFLIGMAYFYQFQNDQAKEFFQKCLGDDHTNLYVKAKSLYYTAFLELEKGELTEFFKYLERSLRIYHSIDAKQGIAWVKAWLGNYYLQKGDLNTAQINFTEALDLFGKIKEQQGVNLVNSLIGLMLYQQGKLEQARDVLERSFTSSIEIGNPMITSYCLIPLVLLHIELGSRSKAEKYIQEFKKLSKSQSSDRVKVHRIATEAIFLKSSPRLIDKAHAQKLFLQLLQDKDEEIQSHGSYVWITSDKFFSFFVIFHLAELYLDEFKLSEDNVILQEVQDLINDELQSARDQKFSPEYIELSLLQAKLMIIEGKIKKSLLILEEIKQIADINDFHRLKEKIGLEIKRIDREFTKWDSAVSVKERIKQVEIEKYLKEVQKFLTFHHQ